ncbi:flavin reductase family protein [Nocardioides humi]|uniref:Flavin reductase family protein n=1 Tax=Nocardioides humi TaxID=449461 RepID=A0ABN2BRU9_9ACTN|nr:flavin reductase family protein [Nocardioides humi]
MTALGLIDEAVAFRATMSRLPSGVSIITTRVADAPVGMTASSVTPLSLDPLQLLVCVGNHLFTRSAISEHGRFGVNVLGEEHQDLARQFASRGDRFAGVSYDEEQGVPVLHDAIASIVCDVAEELPGGDHTIFIGTVVSYEHIDRVRPLIHCGGEFGRIA